MSSRAILPVAVILVTIVLAGCGIHDAPGPCGTFYGATCTTGAGKLPPALIYPLPGASAIPDASVTVVVAAESNAITLTKAPTLVGSVGSPVLASRSFVTPPSPLPSPHAVVYPNEILYAFTYSALAVHTTYTVEFDPNATGCVETGNGCDAGTFTTQ